MADTYVGEKNRRRFSDSGRQVSQWVYEKEHGRIGEGRIVHHKDGNSLNNRPSNLRAMRRSDHSAYHARKRGL